MKEYDDKLEFYGKNDMFEFDKLDNSDDIIREEKIFKNRRKLVKRNKLKNKDNEEHLSHDVVIEYEDGIDQNVEINYEDDLANEYDYEKENEMIKQGINPYNNDANKFNKKNSNNNQNNNKNIKQIIVNDENDKGANEFIQNNNATNLSVMVIRNRSKRLNTTNEQQTTTQPNTEKKESDTKLEHYKRVQRIMNSGPKVVGIFGVNNYNPENSMYANKAVFSPNKTESNVPNSSNKINKTIHIGSKDNHNFVSVINKTRMVPIKKKNTENKTKDKEKSKKNKNDDTVINVINLEENFLNELKDDDKNEMAGNESTNYNSKSNKNNNSNENIENDDNYKSNKPNGENNKNEVQGYFLNIINSKQNKENENENNKSDKLSNDNSENNEFFKNSGNNVVKVTKGNKVGLITKKHPKGLIPNNDTRKTKLTINTDNNNAVSSVNSTRYKVHNSLSKNIVHKKISNNSVTENNYSTINDSSLKRSHSISANMKNEESKNNKYASKVIVSSNISPDSTIRKKSIPKLK